MDQIVLRAMVKWPNVPAVFGWLALDRRGQWRLRGERIVNPMMIDFIQRNYARDDSGRWFFQNGPQRVFVKLDYAPWVLRVADAALVTHTGLMVERVEGAWCDESGVLLLKFEDGVGTIDDRDAEIVASRLVDRHGNPPSEDELTAALDDLVAHRPCDLFLPYARRCIKLEPIRSADVASRFGFVSDPRPACESAGR
jgi:hypothetical protein